MIALITENSGYSKVYLAAEDSVSITADANSKFNTAMHLNNETGSGIEVNINAPKVLIDGTIDTVNSSVAVASDVAVINGNIMQTASSGLKLSGRTAGVKGYALVAGNVDSTNVELTNQSVDQTKGTFKVASLTSSNSTLTFSTMEKGGVTIDTLNGDLGLRAASSITEKLGSAEEAVKTIKEKVLVSANSKDALLSDLSGEASDLTSAWTYDAAADTVVKEGGTNLSPTLTALQKTAGANLAQWRYEVNHLSDRLGDVRNQKGAVGSWARVYGSEAKLSDSVSTKLRANSIQVGADVKVGDNWIVGGAFGYTDQDADYSNGESSTDGYTLAVYGSAYFPCGGYVDLIARAGRLSTDIDATTVSKFDASYDNTAFGVSAEIGYRWDVSKIFYLTPQAELSYGYVRGEDFTGSNGIRVDQDNFETLVGRVGFQAGANFAEGAGTVYLTASLNHDFRGEAEASAVRGTAKVPVAVSTNGHDMSLTASNTGVMGVIYNTTISGKGNLRLESKTNSGLGTGTNKIIGLDSVTVIASSKSNKAITGYGHTTIQADSIYVESADDAIHFMGDADGTLDISGFKTLTLVGKSGYAIQNAASKTKGTITIQGDKDSQVILSSEDSVRNAIRSQGAGAVTQITAGSIDLRSSGSGVLSVSNGIVTLTANNVNIESQSSSSYATAISASNGTLTISGLGGVTPPPQR